MKIGWMQRVNSLAFMVPQYTAQNTISLWRYPTAKKRQRQSIRLQFDVNTPHDKPSFGVYATVEHLSVLSQKEATRECTEETLSVVFNGDGTAILYSAWDFARSSGSV